MSKSEWRSKVKNGGKKLEIKKKVEEIEMLEEYIMVGLSWEDVY